MVLYADANWIGSFLSIAAFTAGRLLVSMPSKMPLRSTSSPLTFVVGDFVISQRMWLRDSLYRYAARGQFRRWPANHRFIQCHCTSIMMCELDGTSALSCATSSGRLAIVGNGGRRSWAEAVGTRS